MEHMTLKVLSMITGVCGKVVHILMSVKKNTDFKNPLREGAKAFKIMLQGLTFRTFQIQAIFCI